MAETRGRKKGMGEGAHFVVEDESTTPSPGEFEVTTENLIEATSN